MPTYSYKCKDCGYSFDIQQSITDVAKTECPECKGELSKIFGVGSVTFKGTGFYKTDNAAGGKAGTDA